MLGKNKFFFFRRFFAIIILLGGALFVCPCIAGRQTADRFLVKAGSGAEPEPRKVFVYDSKGKRDPFIPLVSSEGRILEPQIAKDSEGKLQLEGIIYETSGSSYAVVNGEVIKAGDTCGGYQVLEIQPEKAILVKGSERLEIELKKED